MAIAGAAVQSIRVWLKDGKLMSGNSGHVHGSIVIDDLDEALQKVMAGKTVYLYYYQDNLERLRVMVNAQGKEINDV